MRRLLPSLIALAIGCAPLVAVAQEKIKLRVMGTPLATGNIQKHREQPFFESLAAKTGLPIEIDYKPLDATGIKEFEQLRVMRTGLFDVAGLRLAQISRDEPVILGLDLVGLNSDYATAHKVVAAYAPAVDARLQQQFNVKLLGVWPFGPQIVFCKPAIKGLADLKGLKVRVLDGVMAKFMEKVGATPVTLGFGEVSQALSLGTVDCAVTGPSSANSAGWPESATHVYPLGLQVAVQGYGISLNAWKKLKPEEQKKLQAAFDELVDSIWKYSEELWTDAMNCNAGLDPCTTGKKYKMVTVPVSKEDMALVQSAVREISFPAWAEICDKSVASCSADWKKSVGPMIGLN